MHQSRWHQKAALTVTLTALLVIISACGLDTPTNPQDNLPAPTPIGSPKPALHRSGIIDPSILLNSIQVFLPTYN